MLVDVFLDETFEKEGGYSDRPNDAGGPTMYGITQAVAEKYGYRGDMRKLPLLFARQIYKEQYWDSLNLTKIGELSPSIALLLADVGVNMGIGRAGEFFQRILNAMNNRGQLYPDIKVDGSIGPATLSTFRKYLDKRGKDGEIVMERAINCLKGAFYVSLAERRQTDEENLFGWFLKRVS